MAVSGTTSFTQTKYEIIQMAFFHIGKYGNGRTISSEDYNIASNILNAMIKSWGAKGLHLWAKNEGMLFLTPYQGEYDLGSYSYFTTKNNSETNQLTNNQITGNTSIVVGSTEGIAVNDHIGIVLDTGYIFWTTVSNINIDGLTLTINNALPSSASQSNLVYSFTTTASKPLRVLDARLIQGFDNGSTTSQVELPMYSMAYQDYWQTAMTTISSTFPNQFQYTPGVSNGTLYVWPRPSSGAFRIQMTYERIIDDITQLDETFDFPSEWLEALQWQLALRLCPGYGKMEKLNAIGPIAADMLKNLMDWDNEITQVRFMPDRGDYE